MPTLTLTLLGAPTIEVDNHPIKQFRSSKGLALLAFLAVEATIPHQRETLATLLWSEYPTQQALRNLSQTLSRLRHALNDLDGDSHYFEITSRTLRFQQKEGIYCDLWHFHSLLARCERHEHESLEDCALCQAWLHEAVTMTRGELLEGFTVEDSITFEEWLLLAREFWHERQVEVLELATSGALAAGRYREAISYARQQIALEPWREGARYQLMRALALDGQREAALAQFQSCRRVLAEELGVEPLPATRALYEQIRDGTLGVAPLRRPLTLHHAEHTLTRPALPTPTTRFFGREQELEQLDRQLREGGYRILTIEGPGGMGKTRVALEAARRQLNHFADGVFFVPLVGVERADDIPSAIAHVMALPLNERTTPSDIVLRFLAERQVLLVLDNMEHLLEDVSWLLQLVQSAPRVLLLLTSRERLNVMAEDLYPLGGLAHPPAEASLEEAASSPAVHLFVDRAHRLDKSFLLTADNVEAVIRICQLVEGLPLGIELASTWIREMECQQIAQHIEEGLDFLATDLHDLPPQHRSLRAVFDYSWSLLPREEQQALARLTLFRGGFTRAAAETVAGTTALCISQLRYKSLVRYDGNRRLKLHELVRQYAQEKLWLTPDEAEASQARHSAWYLDLLARMGDPLHGKTLRDAAAELLLELDNVRAAWQYAVARGGDKLEVSTIRALGRFFRVVGYYKEGAMRFAEAAALYRRRLSEEPSAEPAVPLLLSCLVVEQVACARYIENVAHMLDLLSEATALARQVGAREVQLRSKVLEGEVNYRLGRYQAGLSVLQPMLNELQDDDDPRLGGEIYFILGRILGNSGRLEQSNRYYEQALVVQRAVGNRIQEQQVLLYLAVNAILALEYERGARYLQEADGLLPATLSLSVRVRLVNVQGFVAAALGQFGQAKELFEQVRHLSHQIGYRVQESHALHNLCVVHTLEGEWDAAEAAGQAALALGKRCEDPDAEICARMHLGFLALEQEQWARALGELTLVQQKSEALDDRPRAMEATVGLSLALLAQGKLPEALQQIKAVEQFLLTEGVKGTDIPFRFSLLCYQVLCALGEKEAAAGVLHKAHTELMAAADKIHDPALRHSFLNKIKPNQALLKAWQQATLEDEDDMIV